MRDSGWLPALVRRFLRSLLKEGCLLNVEPSRRSESQEKQPLSLSLSLFLPWRKRMQTVGGSLHRTLNRLFVDVRCGNGSRRVRAVIQIDSSIHLVKGALPRYESVIYNWLPECVRTCRCLFQHHRYPLSSAFFHPWITTRIATNFSAKPMNLVLVPPPGSSRFFCHRRSRERSSLIGSARQIFDYITIKRFLLL